MIKVNLYISFTKLLALLIIVLGFISTLILHDSGVFISCIAGSSAILTVRTYANKDKPKLDAHG